MTETERNTEIDGQWLSFKGWQPIGNTWYLPEKFAPEGCTVPIFWEQVSGSIWIGREWKGPPQATRGELSDLLQAFRIDQL